MVHKLCEQTMATPDLSLKKVTTEQLQQALGRALLELTGVEYAVDIRQIDYSNESTLAGPGAVPMQLTVRRVPAAGGTMGF